jgi:hypothetical protein
MNICKYACAQLHVQAEVIRLQHCFAAIRLAVTYGRGIGLLC